MAELNFNFMTVKAYADHVNKKPRTVRRWIRESKVKAKKDRGGHGWLILVENLNTFCKKEKPIP